MLQLSLRVAVRDRGYVLWTTSWTTRRQRTRYGSVRYVSFHMKEHMADRMRVALCALFLLCSEAAQPNIVLLVRAASSGCL